MSDPDKLTMLIHSRGGHRAYTTRVMKETEDYMKTGEANAGDQDALLEAEEDIITNKEILVEKMTVLKGLDEEILSLKTDPDTEAGEAGDYNRKIKKTLVKIDRWMKKFCGPPTQPNPSQPSPSTQVQPGSAHRRLPKVELEPFDGDPLRFRSFWDMFESLIDKDDQIDDVMKFSYLKSKLKDKARLAIEGFTLTNENYGHAKEVLLERFG